jgi:hypothetical protein
MTDDLTLHLTRAARYRALSLLFAPPDTRAAEELVALARDLDDPALRSLAADAGPDASGVYHSALGPTGAVRDSESDYEVNPLGGKGPLLADVAGFYLALRYEDETLLGMSPDHISMELGFMGWLALRAAYARREGEVEGEEVCVRASESFARDHVGRWSPTFFARLRAAGEGSWYDRAATYAQSALEALEPGRVSPPVVDRRRVALPTLDDSDDCGLPPDPATA